MRRRLAAVALWLAAGGASTAACFTGGGGGGRDGGTVTGRCQPGLTRACTLTYDGGFEQSGTQSCNPDRTWAACVGTGACRESTGAPLAAYGRCASEAECGPPGCAACSGYSGVQNPGGFSVCFPYCATDAECAPSTPSADVSPRCVLGQCVLLCRASSTCPRDGQCLPWIDARTGEPFPGFDGLCD